MKPAMALDDGRRRVVIAQVQPQIDGGRYAIKRIVGEQVAVQAVAFADGHDLVRAVLRHRHESEHDWHEVVMEPLGQDRWLGTFNTAQVGRHFYTLAAWVDRYDTWCRDMRKRIDADQDVGIELLVGARLLREAAERTGGHEAGRLEDAAATLSADRGVASRALAALDPALVELARKYPDRSRQTTYQHELAVVVDGPKARCSAWYEMFPRSCASEPGRHGTLKDCARRLPYVASMGFDVLYLPPIHPIGTSYRKGKNNSPQAEAGDVGSPWGIGSEEGGHKAIHPALGTFDDFHELVEQARTFGIDVALDVALQCSPDHPYVKEHPEWFRLRPDGSIQYAENPPKKYQDIYPIDFETPQWRELWDELKSIFTFWIGHGVRIFRVDNPHTKPFAFWEWVIAEVKRDNPDAIFLSEAFTRPQVMYELAKRGFTQSYTYFTWRNTSQELKKYFTELTCTEVHEFFRPNVWPNTPDILPEYLQTGGRPAFMSRLVLAATLGANYGIYGPAFELCEGRPREPGSEEYLNSEKYQLVEWDLTRSDNLAQFIGRVNQIRRENPALQSDGDLQFHDTTNEQLLCYSKQAGSNLVIAIVNLDPYHKHSGWVEIPAARLGLEANRPYQVHDLLGEGRYLWHGERNYVELDPRIVPAHLFRVRRWVRTEHQFEYFL
ncbi:MAG TPA: alpha-1,4-glucan--maltose-1-phosphate maltosyltransferase [Pirellulales bacterium]|nr:alpha-1,4-glucan--maltose-1-phosphate maltosyltransferase [Pirellulales bacterium]